MRPPFGWGSYMPPHPKEPEPEPEATEADLVRAWRVAGAMGLGYEWTDAVGVADSNIDLHRLQDLLARGATHAQAYLILA